MKFPNLRITVVGAAVAAAMALAPMASATVTGNLNTGSGCATVTVNATSILWGSCTQGTPPDATANFVVGGATTMTYGAGTPVPIGDPGHLINLFNALSVAPPPTTLPLDLFMTVDGTPLDFVLNTIGPGPSNTNCAGLSDFQTCAASAGSPFSLQLQPGGQTAVSLAVSGIVYDNPGHTGGSNWNGSFTTQLNETPSQIQSTINAGGSVTSTHSGSFIATAVPEPSTAFLGLSGLLIGAGLIRRRRQS